MKKIIVTELIPTDSRKSFNGRAKIVEANGRKNLLSYSTLMCGIDSRGKIHRYSDFQSATTNRHVKAFLETVGADCTTSEFKKLPLEQAPDIGIDFA